MTRARGASLDGPGQHASDDPGSQRGPGSVRYWESVEAMSRFAGKDPTRIHHLDRDREFLSELPDKVQILEITASKGVFA